MGLSVEGTFWYSGISIENRGCKNGIVANMTHFARSLLSIRLGFFLDIFTRGIIELHFERMSHVCNYVVFITPYFQ